MIRIRNTRVRRRILLAAGFLAFWIVQLQRSFQPVSEGNEDVIKMVSSSEDSRSLEKEAVIFEPVHICLPEDQYDQLDPCLVNFVKANLLIPPPPHPQSKPGKSGNSSYFPANGEKLAFIRKHLIEKNRKPGFFIECGAYDGERLSTTLPLERDYNWTGVLIEPNSIPFMTLIGKGRNAWAINVALCVTTHSDQVSFFKTGGPANLMEGLHERKGLNQKINVTCIPLYTILAALNVSTVDFFSLDVEGSDLDVLKTVPYDRIVFKVVAVEHAHVTGFQIAVVEFLESKGYKFIGTLIDYFSQDSLFVHESIYTPDMALKIKFQETGGATSMTTQASND